MYIPLLSLVPILSFPASPPPSPNSGSFIALSHTVSLFFCYFGRTFHCLLFFYHADIFGEHGPVNLESVPQLGLLGPCFLTVWFTNACLAGELQKGHGSFSGLHLRPRGIHLPLIDGLNFGHLVSESVSPLYRCWYAPCKNELSGGDTWRACIYPVCVCVYVCMCVCAFHFLLLACVSLSFIKAPFPEIDFHKPLANR